MRNDPDKISSNSEQNSMKHFRKGVKFAKKVISNINHEKYRWKLKSLAEPYCKKHGIELVVKEADSTSINSISDRDIDMLMIDSLHIRSHMEKELSLHGSYIQKYIIAHDTTICQDRPKDALYRCLSDFCDNNNRWSIIERGKTNVGYTVLKKS